MDVAKKGEELVKEEEKCFNYTVDREEGEANLQINTLGCPFYPSLEDSEVTMEKTVDIIIEVGAVATVTFQAERNYIYPFEQTNLLNEIATAYIYFVKEMEILKQETLTTPEHTKLFPERLHIIRHIIMEELKRDPIGAYVTALRTVREQRAKSEIFDPSAKPSFEKFINVLQEIISVLEKTKIIKLAKPYVPGYKIGSRELYFKFFEPFIRPNFMFTRLQAEPPTMAEEVASYSIGEKLKANVLILELPKQVRLRYHVVPPEFQLDEDEYVLLDETREIMAKFKPKEEEFIDPRRMRAVFLNIAKDLITQVSKDRGMDLSYSKIEKLSYILVRLTVGFGMIEVLLDDPKVEDIYVNAPIGVLPIFVKHADFGECETNIIPNKREADSWASRFRLISGRPLDEANPVLDTELDIPGVADARVAVIQNPLSPGGYSFAFRHHRERPWTIPLLIHYKSMSPTAGGLLSFLVDGARTMLIAGTRGSGKTSLLSAMMLEIMRKFRIITVEDTLEIPTRYFKEIGYNVLPLKVRSAILGEKAEMSADDGIRTSLRLGDSALIVGEVRSSIRGNEEVFIVENGETKRIPIKDVENLCITDIKVPTLNEDLKIELHPLKDFVKHPRRKKLLEITTKTGRKVTVTEDHSVFTANNFQISPIECNKLKKGDPVIIPSSMPCGYNDVNSINLVGLFPKLRISNADKYIKEAIKKLGYKKASEICETSNDIYQYLRKGNERTNIPIDKFVKLMQAAEIEFNPAELKIKKGTSTELNAEIKINEGFCRLLGYYVSEGYVSKDKTAVIFSNSNPKIVDDIVNISKSAFGINPYVRETKGLGYAKQIAVNCAPLAHLLTKLGCGRTCTEKRIPSLIFGLSQDKIASFLRALYSGDGSFTASKSSGNSVRYYTTSRKLAEDVMYILLTFGIIGRIHERKRKENENTVHCVEFKQRDQVETFLNKIGFVHKQPKSIKKGWSHSQVNMVKFSKDELSKHIDRLPRAFRHLRRFGKCSKYYLRDIIEKLGRCSGNITDFAKGEFFIDKIANIKEIILKEPELVYDLSLNPTQNFIGGFGGIILHNTEARALYESMRIGALANVVAGTIHGDSPYGVFDRVVNDLGVPRTSFKATDIIIIAGKIRSPDQLREIRRLTHITEIRKTWQEDPSTEGGFMNLMEYDAKEDIVKPTRDLIEGESEIVKSIAGRVKEWVGNWDAVWDNILLRANTKKMLVDYAQKTKRITGPNGLLEADFVVEANDMFHRIFSKLKEETGYPDSKSVLTEYEHWLKNRIKKGTDEV